MVENYEREIDSLYPQVYHTFMAKGLENDELVEYYVQDLTEDHFKKALELIFKFFLPEDTFQQAVCKSQDQTENVSALQTNQKFFKETLSKKVSLACFEKKTNEMVGLNTLAVKSRVNQKANEFEDRNVNNVVRALELVSSKFNVFNHFNVDHYLSGVGLCVDSRYRGRGIAVGILKARRNFLPKLNLKVTSTLFTTIGSQKAAVKAGYTEQSSTSYEEIQQNFPDMDFSVAETTHCKILTLEV